MPINGIVQFEKILIEYILNSMKMILKLSLQNV